MNRKLLLVIITIITFTACKTETKKEEPIKTKKIKMVEEIEKIEELKYNYNIINEDVDRTFNKTSIEVRLTEEISEIELKNIALELKGNRSGYTKIWIFYFLPEQEPGNGAWAITHFKPELEVEILGATKEATNRMNSIKVTGQILNSWYDNDPLLSNKKYLVTEKGKTFIKTIYSESKYADSGGELIEKVVKVRQKNGLIRYDYDNNHGEYYLIESSGNLGLYDDSGKFKECIRIDVKTNLKQD